MFSKDVRTVEGWVINIGNKAIPIDVVKAFIQTILVCVIVYAAYNVGVNDAYEYVKLAAYMGTPVCDASGVCHAYKLEQQNNKIAWVEITTNIKGNNTFNFSSSR